MQVQTILCICTGNICRSPLAEGLFKRDARFLTAASAGIGAVVGGQMPAPAAAIAARESLDLANHRGRQVTADMLSSHDLVLVMEAGQRSWLTAQFPQARGRVFLASHWRGGEDIPDPFQKTPEYFEYVFDQIVLSVNDWIERLAPSDVLAHR